MMKGYKAKSHYLAMRKWVFDALKEKKQKQGYQKSEHRQHLVIDHEQLDKDYAGFVGTYIGGDE